MKTFIFSFLFFMGCLAFFACSKSEDNIPESTSIIGKWKLIETYSDPGDGSGKFRPIKSNKILEFDSMEVRTNEGGLCNNRSNSTYSLSEREYEGRVFTVVSFVNCESNYSYIISENTFTIYYNCIEGCGERYKRIK